MLVQEDVGWFEIAVNDSVGMRGGDGFGDGQQKSCRNCRVERTFGNPFCEIAAFDQGHRVEQPSPMFADMVNGNDASMPEGGGRNGLVAETTHFRRRQERSVKQHFEGNVPTGGSLSGPINDPHAAAADLVEQIVIAELAGRRARFQRRLIQGTAGKSLNQIDVGKVVSQRGFMLAMFRKKCLAVSRLAVVDPRQVLREDGCQAIGTWFFGTRRARSPSANYSRSCKAAQKTRNPLAMVAAAAWQVHCNSIEISANERPSRCRRRTASRCLDGNRSSAMQSRS